VSLPTSMTLGRFALRRAGMRVAALPGDNTYWAEVQCSSSTSFPTSRTRIVKLPPSAANFVVATFEVPYSTRTFYARSRHFKTGYSTGPWSTLASGKPDYLVDQMPHPGMYAHHVVRMGALSSAWTKTIRLMPGNMVPQYTSHHWQTNYQFIKPNTTGVTQSFFGPVTLPQGVTITKFAVRCIRGGVASTAIFGLRRVVSTGGVTALATLTATTGLALQLLNSSAMSELVTSTRGYSISGSLKTTKLTYGFGGELLYADITYTVPHLGAAY
jgi:hypothetical protein